MQLKDTKTSGVYNLGTGRQLTFHDIASEIQKRVGIANAQIMTVPMPDHVVKNYQWESLANLNKLRSVLPGWNPQTVSAWLDENFDSLYNKIAKELLNGETQSK